MRARLYLATPPALIGGGQDARWDRKRFLALYEEALAAGDIAAVMLRDSAQASDDDLRQALDDLRPAAHASDAALILENRLELALQSGCDGVHVDAGQESVKKLRQAIGEDVIVGASCGASRDLAMTAAEGGADYVAFGGVDDAADPELIAWWAEIMEVPCVAFSSPALSEAEPLLSAGADFLCLGGQLWEYPSGPAAALGEVQKTIERYAG